ncbi:MAG: endolytic transglycosylase MltG [Alphaproteobacteria bacterium]|nr:endolytic transglycosylase MltG [Alphaproteobacteria bacterium]
MLKKVLLTLQIMFVLFVAATVLLYFKAVDVIQTPHKVDEPKIIQISNGESLTSIARNLKKNNLIENEFYFILYSKINKVYPKVKAGEYLIEKDISLRQLADLLTSGKVYLRKITFAEGLTAREISDILYAENLLEGDFKVLKEGEFLPETYTFSRGTQRQKIVAQGIDAMQKILDQAWQERDADLPLKNKEELLILASIVEKETGVATERPQVASVFVNRLKRGMLLQTDPTVIYALTQGRQDLGRALTRRDLTVDSPYNTYKYAGLPPTPICSPGAASIKATAHPDKTPYLYFVASGNGGHNFARTLQEHNINVREYKKHR